MDAYGLVNITSEKTVYTLIFMNNNEPLFKR